MKRLCLAFLCLPAVSASAQSPFTIAVLPDTQNYSSQSASTPGGPLDFFRVQTQWIVANQSRNNIVFATQLGDIVNNASTPNGANPGSANAQWNVAVGAMNVLKNSSVPHSILPGNHDWTSTNGTGSLVHYRSRFGDTSGFYSGKSWFLGFDPSRGANSAQRFSTPAGDMLHLALEWNAINPAVSSDRPDASGNAIAWAQGVIDANPGIPTIISTHNYITPSGVRDSNGQGLFDTLVSRNAQVFMTLNGHYVGGGGSIAEASLVSTNQRGLPVYQMLSDYQSRNRGGDGWMRLLEFQPESQSLRVRTYTPVSSGVSTNTSGVGATVAAGSEFGNQGLLEVDSDSDFTLPLDFRTRFAAPIQSVERSFRNGENGYAGTQDTYLEGDSPSTNNGNSDHFWVDAVATSASNQSLIRFDQLFGSAANQIPLDRDIVSARIRVRVTGSNAEGSGFLAHRMLRSWSESSATWASLTNGVSNDGREALARPTSQLGVNASAVGVTEGYVDIDVTRDIRAYLNGATNHGVALLPFELGTNGIRMASSEAINIADRPQLIVDVTAQSVVTRRFQNGSNGYNGTQDTEIRQGNLQQSANLGANVNLLVDDSFGSVAPGRTQAVLRFDSIFGNGASQVPTDARVVSATLKLNVNDVGSGLMIHRLTRNWSEQSTWRSLVDGMSIGSETTLFAEALAGVENESIGIGGGLMYFDVTASLMAWMSDPLLNFGWLLSAPIGATDGLRIDSSEAIGINTFRPELIVRYLPGSPLSPAQVVPEPAFLAAVSAFAFITCRRRGRAM